MSWRTLFISSASRLRLKQGNLHYESELGVEHMLALEDISVIIVDTPQLNMSNALLEAFAKHDIVYFCCDNRHHPCGIYIPYNSNSRVSEVSYLQIGLKSVIKKRLWQRIIQRKIRNQAYVLDSAGVDSSSLRVLARKVKSNDSDNKESQASQIYFIKLFGKGFVRGREDLTLNVLLNYGYAILRGLISRNLVVSGLQPWLGIWHSSGLNRFNLSDDIIEIYRPFIDHKIYSNIDLKEDLPQLKKQLVDVLNMQCVVGGDQMSILNAVSRSCSSLVRVLKLELAEEFEMPRFKEDSSFL